METVKRYILLVIAIAGVLGAMAQVNTEQVMRIGRNALYFEDYMLSVQYFNQAIGAKPYLAQPYLYRSIAKLNLEDYTGARDDASEAIRLNPFLPDAFEVRGVANQNMGNLPAAIADYDAALALLPRNRQLLFNKALAQSDLEQFEAADSTFALLLGHYPSFASGYIGRARARLLSHDTIAAREDIDRALNLDRNQANAYIMRADIAINSQQDYNAALEDIDQAIRLLPRHAGLYVNRAFLRYNLGSYTGAMEDFDYALTLDPLNQAALFNRAMLAMEVGANDRALADLNRFLQLSPRDPRALYNRAIVYREKEDYENALADIETLMEIVPELPSLYYLRGSIRQEKGQLAMAEADYRRGRRMLDQLDPSADNGNNIARSLEQEAENTANVFSSLLTLDDNAEIDQQYNNDAIRGRVQDRNVAIEPEPPMWLSFYTSPNELNTGTAYLREADDLNATRALRFLIAVTNRPPAIDPSTADRHFQSIQYYNSYLATHTPRPVDYLGRALDFLTVRDYSSALRDADRAIALAPDLALGYLVRAQARYGLYLLERDQPGDDTDGATRRAMAAAALSETDADLDRMLALSPMSAVAWYDKGCVHLAEGNLRQADEDFTNAIALRTDFGEAYFNRGYIRLQNGDRNAGVADLGKAGELGVVGAYNLIKRISR